MRTQGGGFAARVRIGAGSERRAESGVGVWITWERHRRTRELASALHLELHELVSDLRRPARYIPLVVATLSVLVRRRPRLVFVQCPSVPLACLVLLLKLIFRYTVVVDLHNEAVHPFNFTAASYLKVLRWIWRSADLSLVTNEPLEPVIRTGGGRPFVLPDRVPTFDDAPVVEGFAGDQTATPSVVFVCTFAADEPYGAVIDAARMMDSVTVSITGDRRRAPTLGSLPRNVRLTGYLPDHEYEDLLRRADVIVDLTEMEDCLVCGGYEAVALEKPLVTSHTQALRTFFSAGTVHTRHSPEELAVAVRSALDRRDALADEMRGLKARLKDAWNVRLLMLTRMLSIET